MNVNEKKVVLVIIIVLAVLGASIYIYQQQYVSLFGYFRLEPGDPHFLEEKDPDNLLTEYRDYWESKVKTWPWETTPEIYFYLPEVSNAKGTLSFKYSTSYRVPVLELELYASQSQSGPYTKVWSGYTMGLDDWQTGTVTLQRGYVYYKFVFSTDARLAKTAYITTEPIPAPTPTPTPIPTPTPPSWEPTPTPTPVPTPTATPTPTPQSPINTENAPLIFMGALLLIAAFVLLRGKEK